MNYGLYIFTFALLIFSYYKDKGKTIKALKKGWKAFSNILPEFLSIILFVGIMLSLVNTDTISNIIGGESGWLGIFLASSVGAITLIPGFVAFPMAALLLDSGAGYMQLGAFISSLMMVGVVTMPAEIKYFGIKLTLLRNILAFLFSFIVAYVIGLVVI